MKIRLRALVSARLVPVLFLSAVAFAAGIAVDANLYLDDIKFLASGELRGRASGSPELEKAAAFLESHYRQFGIQPVGASYLQPFPITTDAALGAANRFQFTSGANSISLRSPREFVPLNISAAGKLAGEVVFAGYGITAPEYHYDDYAGIDVKGKLVLVLRHEPQEADANSVFEGKSLTQHAQFAAKATNAKIHGAVGVILINDRAAHAADPEIGRASCRERV